MPPSKKHQKWGWKECWEDVHGLYFRHGEHGLQYYFAEVIDMEDACGRDNEGHPPYVWEATLLDLTQLPTQEIASAVQSCGGPEALQDVEDRYGKQARFDRQAEMCKSCGLGAPLGRGSAQKFVNARAQAIECVEKLISYPPALKEQLSSPQNKIGTTGYDLLKGDLMAGLRRSAEEVLCGTRKPTPEEKLMFRVYTQCKGMTLGGVTEESLALSQQCALAESTYRTYDDLPYAECPECKKTYTKAQYEALHWYDGHLCDRPLPDPDEEEVCCGYVVWLIKEKKHEEV